MAEDFKIQLSVKKGEGMLNIRAEHSAEFHALYTELAALPELSGYFPLRSVPSAVEEKAEAPASDKPLSALEIARQRMKGGS